MGSAGRPLHDAEGLEAFSDEIRQQLGADGRLEVLDCHINDAAFVERVLQVFDEWVAQGIIRR